MADNYQFFELSSNKLSSWIERAMCTASRNDLLKRIWNHDFTLWADAPDEISNRLGWLTLHETMREQLPEIEELASQVKKEGYKFALLLGMGGSSLAPEVFRNVFGVAEGYLDLAVLDSTDPQAVAAAAHGLDFKKTLFIVSTKSGGTVETLSFFKYFYNLTAEKLGADKAGQHFIAITDPGSSLEALAKEYRFRHTFLNDPKLGGRYSALSHFGLVPAALLGIDIAKLLDQAAQTTKENGSDVAITDSPAVLLGTLLGKGNKAHLDKVTFISDPKLESFEDWVEQLIAESTGKSGKGILPVAHEPVAGKLADYGSDRIFVFTHLGDSKKLNQLAADLDALEHPYIHLRLKDKYQLGKLILLWELAVAVAGEEIRIHPFNQPNVESAKVLARESVAAFQKTGKLPQSLAQPLTGQAFTDFLAQKKTGDYISLQAYIQPTLEAAKALHKLQAALRDRTGLAVTVGFGPRFLHSTGQLHKGGKNNGLFIQFVSNPEADLSIPEKAGSDESFISFGVLKQAQAIGDAQALQQAGRRLIVFSVESAPEKQLNNLVKQLQ